METIDIPAEMMPQPMYPAQPGQQDDVFTRVNDLRVIQEYNQEENLPDDVKKDFWALASKSIKLGFWEKGDEEDLYFMRNIINVGHIMQKPKHRYSFRERQQMNMLRLLVYADFKRGVGMERYKINERTLQATSVTQSIQGAGAGANRRGGVIAGLKSIFA